MASAECKSESTSVKWPDESVGELVHYEDPKEYFAEGIQQTRIEIAISGGSSICKAEKVKSEEIDPYIYPLCLDTSRYSEFFKIIDAPPSPGWWYDDFPKQLKGMSVLGWFKKYNRKSRGISAFQMPNPSKHTIGLLPIGDCDSWLIHKDQSLIQVLCEITALFYELPVRIIQDLSELDKLRIDNIHQRMNSDTLLPQLLTTDIHTLITEIRRRKENRDLCVLIAVSMIDLYPKEDWNYVFGQARPSKGSGVFSFARYMPGFDDIHGDDDAEDADDGSDSDKHRKSLLSSILSGIKPHRLSEDDTSMSLPLSKEDKSLFLKRCIKVLQHELGHLFGFNHCPFFHCLMNGSNHLEESDQKPVFLCPVCLQKLYFSRLKNFHSNSAAMKKIKSSKRKVKATVMGSSVTAASSSASSSSVILSEDIPNEISPLNLLQRYQNLSKFYKVYCLDEESQWYSDRVSFVSSD